MRHSVSILILKSKCYVFGMIIVTVPTLYVLFRCGIKPLPAFAKRNSMGKKEGDFFPFSD